MASEAQKTLLKLIIDYNQTREDHSEVGMYRELIEYLKLGRRRQWSASRRSDRQNRLFRKVVRRAYEDVPLYRSKLLSYQITPDSITSIDDLTQLPVFRKSDFNESPLENRVSRNADYTRMETVATSGSTGVPLQIGFSSSEGARRRACLLRTFVDLGAPFMHKRLVVKTDLRPTQPSFTRALLRFNLKSCSPEKACGLYVKYRPDVISGLPTVLHIFALEAKTKGVGEFRPQLVVPSGEMLFPDTERLLRETFQAPVRPYYGCWEFGVVAAWCDQAAGYHLVTDNIVVECLKDGKAVKDQERGELTLTGLTSWEMPFIRYSTGDLAEVGWDPCECGRLGPTIRNLYGREDDFLVLRDGRLIPPVLAIKPLFDLLSLRQYRVIQEGFENYRIEYAGIRDLTNDEQTRIKAYFSSVLGASEVDFQSYPELPSEASGKLRKVISRVIWKDN